MSARGYMCVCVWQGWGVGVGGGGLRGAHYQCKWVFLFFFFGHLLVSSMRAGLLLLLPLASWARPCLYPPTPPPPFPQTSAPLPGTLTAVKNQHKKRYKCDKIKKEWNCSNIWSRFIFCFYSDWSDSPEKLIQVFFFFGCFLCLVCFPEHLQKHDFSSDSKICFNFFSSVQENQTFDRKHDFMFSKKIHPPSADDFSSLTKKWKKTS